MKHLINLIIGIEWLQLFLSFNTYLNEILLLLGSSGISNIKIVLIEKIIHHAEIVKHTQLIIAVLNKIEKGS